MGTATQATTEMIMETAPQVNKVALGYGKTGDLFNCGLSTQNSKQPKNTQNPLSFKCGLRPSEVCSALHGPGNAVRPIGHKSQQFQDPDQHVWEVAWIFRNEASDKLVKA